MHTYPTVEEAFAHKIKLKPEIIQKVLDWKHITWRDWAKKEKFYQFNFLKTLIQEILGDNTILIYFGNAYFSIKDPPAIVLGPVPSVISTLHEVGHQLYGSSELEACAFSLQLFKEVFPKDFAKLKPHGHMMTL